MSVMGSKKEKKIKNRHGRSTNFLLGEDFSLTFNNNPYNKFGLQDNGLGWIHNLVIGATGTGKSRYFVRPNIYSLPTDPITGRAISMVITDPKGELLTDTGAFLEAHGYIVKVFNLFQMDVSDCYNPFAYIRNEQDIAVLVQGVVANMGEGKNQGDHWEANARYVLQGIISYIYYEMPYTEANFGTVLKLLNMWESSESDGFMSDYDYLIEALAEEKGEDHPAVTWRRKVSAKGSELASIISTAQTVTGVFNQAAIRTMTETDSMELDKVGDRPTALFILTPPTTKAFNFLAALMYTQLFTLLQNKANLDYKNQGMTLPHKVWFILDEFANIGKIPDFDVQITLIRSAGMFCSIIVQSPSQIEAIYDKIASTIMSNCSITLFLGAPGNTPKDDSAADYISRNLGQKTIQAESTSVNYDKSSSNPHISHSYAATQRPLMTTDEVKRLPNDECIILLGGSKPIRTKKIQQLEQCMNYDIYKKIGNYDIIEKKSTKVTYIEGRNKSAMIEKIQDQCRADEELNKKEFLRINQDYMDTSIDDITPAGTYVSVEDKFANLKDSTSEEITNVVKPIKGFNYKSEYGEDLRTQVEFFDEDDEEEVCRENYESKDDSDLEDDKDLSDI